MTPEHGPNKGIEKFVVQKQRVGITSGGINHPIPPAHEPEVEHHKKPVNPNTIKIIAGGVAGLITLSGLTAVVVDQGKKHGWFGVIPPVNSDTPTPGESSSSQSNSDFISGLESSIEESSAPNSESNSVITSSESKSEVKPTATPEDLVMKEKLALAPDVEGTVKVVKELNGLKRVVYEAVKGNRFGLEAGSYAGEYKKEISFEGQETGGIALVPKIAEKILIEEIAKQTDEQGKWLIPMILDISDMKTLKEVKITKADGYVSGSTDCMWGIEVDEPVSVAFYVPGGSEIVSGTLALDQSVTVIHTSFYKEGNNKDKIVLGKEMNYISMSSPFDGQPICWTKKTFSFGESMGNTSKECRMAIGSKIEIINPTFEKILAIEKDGEKIPVFIVSN